MFDMAPVAVLPSEAGDGLEEQDSYFTQCNTCVSQMFDYKYCDHLEPNCQ